MLLPILLYMSEYEYIDESGNVPRIKGGRIDMIDIMAVIESGDEKINSNTGGFQTKRKNKL